MYSISGYGSMIADRVRMNAYAEALRRSIRPGDVVVDLGAGTCIMSCIAVQAGAAKVYAIEPADALELGRVIVRANGMEDRVEFFHACSESVSLPEKADVIVSDLRGVLPAGGTNFRTIADARLRFLKPGGAFIPQTDALWAALVEAPEAYETRMCAWKWDGLDLSAGARMAANAWVKFHAGPEQLLSEPVQWTGIDYTTVETSSLSGTARAILHRGGVAHGLCVWFDTVLSPGVEFSNAPGQPEAIYGHGFFPLPEPVPVTPGDSFEVTLRADWIVNQHIWSWNTHIRSADGECRAAFRQSTFWGAPHSADRYRSHAESFVPRLHDDARIDRTILDRFGSGLSLREISAEISALFPGRFPDWKVALDRVAAISDRYPH